MLIDDHDDGEPKATRTVQWVFAGAMGDYPGLRHLFGAYLHQDWPIEHEDWRGAIDQFTRESSFEEVAEVRGDLQALVNAGLTEAELEEVMAQLQCAVTVETVGGKWSTWLSDLEIEIEGKGHHDG